MQRNNNSQSESNSLEKACRAARRPLGMLFSVYVFVSVLLVMLTPIDILQYQLARDLIALPAILAPAFMDVPALSPTPDVVRFYFGVTWLLYPIFTLIAAYLFFRFPVKCLLLPSVTEMARSRSRLIFLLLITSVLGSGAVVHSAYELYSPVESQFKRLYLYSSWTLAVGGTLHNMGLLLLSSGNIILVRVLWHAWGNLPWVLRKN